MLRVDLKEDKSIDILNAADVGFLKQDTASGQIINDELTSKNTFWTMIYNEGFEMRINKHRLFTFNEYFKQRG